MTKVAVQYTAKGAVIGVLTAWFAKVSMNVACGLLVLPGTVLCKLFGWRSTDCMGGDLLESWQLWPANIVGYAVIGGWWGMLVGFSREGKRNALGTTCGHCKYNLTGNVSGICPECGNPIEENAGH